MPAITVTEGDFGSGVEARVDSSAFYLPDPANPGTVLIVPLADVAQMDTISSDHAGQVKAGLKLSARGFMAAGPLGLAVGLLAAGRVRNLSFGVVLADGRRFAASTSADIYAEIHSAQLAARSHETGGYHPADAIIARYVDQQKQEAAPPVSEAAPEPPPARSSPPRAAAAPRPAPPADAPRPVFGRRRRNDLPPAG